MGDAKSGPVRLSFNPQLCVEFRDSTLTFDAGLLLPRELDEHLGLSALIERDLCDPRIGRTYQFPLRDLFRQSIYSRLAGYEDTNDTERLAEDPAFRVLASRERRETSVALTSTLHWSETEVLAEERNYQGLLRLNRGLVQHEATRSSAPRVILDIDSSESPVQQYQAASWDRPRRVIAKVEHHLGELFPRVGFIVTTLTGTNRAVVHFYNQRGTAEQWIKEGKEATHWTGLSCHRFRANEVRLLLGVIAYNLGNLLRPLVLPLAIQSWSLTSLQQRLFKTSGRLIRHARYFVLQLAEGYLTRCLFRQIVGRIEQLTWHPT
jgi:DDE family transposase